MLECIVMDLLLLLTDWWFCNFYTGMCCVENWTFFLVGNDAALKLIFELKFFGTSLKFEHGRQMRNKP